jgi:hypothetical protein
MALKRNDKGQNVQDFQNKLLALGMKLPRWGADGDLGNETFAAFNMLSLAHSRAPDPDPEMISDAELAWVDSLITLLNTPHTCKPPDRLIDRRKFAGRTYDYGPRPITEVRGATMHQTACILSVSKDPARCDDIGAHYTIMRPAGGYYSDGDVIWLHDDTRRIIHGNEWNTQCWGAEIDGLFAGIEGDPRTVWDDPKTPYKETAVSVTDKQIESTCQLIEWRYYETLRLGGKMHSLNTHRQSSANRRNDPGSKVAQEIVAVMMKKLGLTDGGPGFVLGGPDGGYPNPREWFPNDPTRSPYGYFDAPSYKPVR